MINNKNERKKMKLHDCTILNIFHDIPKYPEESEPNKLPQVPQLHYKNNRYKFSQKKNNRYN